ncbi:DNA-processing protein DprA [Bacillus benzoevorans]|uniref:DNA processing protein n=1 Tax=Bacillus benzoevorans TaxID=1456 RepID=A0A7X0LWQ8_9BACI|nr:DNA-processing protein DprA [Bacillus benzoevorans]MBB6446983.1 DNA processing protein [Bacillus benzoevorans]
MDIYWVWMSLVKYTGPVLQKRLLEEFGTPEAVYHASLEELQSIRGISKRAVLSILDNRDLMDDARSILQSCEKKGIQLLKYSDPLYPLDAKNCKESPILFYFKGNLQKITQSVGVVGSRRCTAYGRRIAEELGRELAVQGIPYISGFAKGIDSYGQAACISQGGYSVSFLAGGVDVCYPPEQKGLYRSVLENGGVFLSQHPPGTKPFPIQFVQRNSFISAWSSELVIVEAGEKSGALWTADFALKQGKTVYSVPHPIYSLEGKGCNNLFTKGAVPYLGKESLEVLRTTKNAGNSTSKREQNQELDPIIQLLSSQTSAAISSLMQTLNMNESTAMDRLFALELKGKIIIRGDIVSLL